MNDRFERVLLSLAPRFLLPPPPRSLRYGLAVGLTIVIALIKLATPAAGEEGPGLLLTIPVAISAVLAGLGPALLATAAGTAVIVFFLPPSLTFAIGPDVTPIRLGAFLLEGLVISVLGSALRAMLIRTLQSLRRLEELEKERGALIATVTHEFRNPLAALSSHLQLATRYFSRDDLRDRLPRSLDVASAQVSRLLRLTEDLLVVATSPSVSMRVDAEVVSLTLAAEAAVARALAAAPSRRIDCLAPPAPVTVFADRARLDQILDNLLGNSIRYTPADAGIELNVASDANRRVGLIRVRDRGPGVSPAERERIFERFARGSAAHGTVGSGIGLYISRELARRMGGRLVLEQTSQDGSVFAVELPLAPTETLVPESLEEQAVD